MFLWFAGLTLVSVVSIFASPAIDYRLVLVGSVLPVIEVALGGPWVMHTLAFPCVVLALVMILGRGRRLVQRRWLGLVIGLFFYLVFDGAWARTELFWWPAFDVSVDEADLPGLEPLWALVVMEVVGAGCLLWAWRSYGLSEPTHRETFLRTGRLPRSALRGEPPSC